MNRLAIFILFFISIVSLYSQNDLLECEKFRRESSMKDIWVEEMPQVIGGIPSVLEKLIYPKEALENKISGKVYVLVFIDTLGRPNCPKVAKGIGYGCDEEAIRLVMSSKYTPCMKRGKPLGIDIMFPILFDLPD